MIIGNSTFYVQSSQISPLDLERAALRNESIPVSRKGLLQSFRQAIQHLFRSHTTRPSEALHSPNESIFTTNSNEEISLLTQHSTEDGFVYVAMRKYDFT